MRNILRFLVKYHFVITFVLFESLAIFLVIKNNNFQQAKFVNFAQDISGYMSAKADQFNQYLSLRSVNQQLAAENAALKNELEKYKFEKKPKVETVFDTLHKQEYTYLTAKVVNNSVNKQYNYITLNRGSEDGVKPEMAVISENGVVGVVQSATDHYALVISLLNRNLKVSSKLKRSNYFGSFEWSGSNYQKGFLNDIPLHVKLNPGDTIVTSGYSTIFPEGIKVGYVTEVESKGGSFYDISLQISNDFKSISYVYVVTNLKKNEQELLESLVKQ